LREDRLEPVRRVLLCAGLAVGMVACTNPAATPTVTSIVPADGAQNVSVSTTIQATLSLPDAAGKVNIATLTDATASLTDAAGVAVPAKRNMMGDTLVVDPTTDLEPDTTYEFVVTSGLQTENGTAISGASSTFTTEPGGTTVPGSSLAQDRPRVIFSAGGASSADTRTLTLTNVGDAIIDVSSLSVEGDAAAQFSLTDSSAFSLAPGEARTLELTFTLAGLGPQLATLMVVSNDPVSGTLPIPLGGLGIKGQGGNLEPSLQWIFDTYGLPIASGDADASTTALVSTPTNQEVGSEVSGRTFTKASPTDPVTVEVLAAFGVENDPVLEFGYYAAGEAGARTQLFEVAQTPGLNAQRLAPEITGGTNGTVSFDPGTGGFGFYSFWPTNIFFGERYVYTEDRLNTFEDAVSHHVRVYPYKGADGKVEANAYVLATDEYTKGSDYNDVVVIVRNVVPVPEEIEIPQVPIPTPAFIPADGIPGLSLRNALGFPYDDRLVLQKTVRTTGNFCDPEIEPACKDPSIDRWSGMKFPNTGVVELRNTGATPLQLTLGFGNQGLFSLPGGESTLSLQPGQSYDLTIQFAPTVLTAKGVYPSSLVVQSGAQSAGIELRGLFMRRPEGSGEVYFGFLVNDLFGYKTDLGTLSSGGLRSPAPNSSLAGEEVRAPYWEAADPGSPVTALQLAAFYPCCTGGTFPLLLVRRGSNSVFASMRPLNLYKQSILPRQQNGDLTELTTKARGPFEIIIAGYSSNPGNGKGRGNLGVRFWPLRDRSGGAFPNNTYLVAQDFVEDGCNGYGAPPAPPPGDNPEDADPNIGSNCDYQDNLYIMTNIKPVN